MVGNIRLILICALALSCVGQSARGDHAELPPGMSEAEAAWLWGYYTVPADITRDDSPYWYGYAHTDVNKINDPVWTHVAQSHIKPGAKAPAVLIMHGCAGIIRSPVAYRVFFMNRGYAVFEPDAFARPGHVCDFENSLDKRTEELGYALEQMRNLPWVDANRIVLMGLSEGGRAVAFWDKSGFVAHIILMANCDGGAPRAPELTPVLAVVGEKDEYLAGTSCKITRAAGGSTSIIIPGAPHGIIDYLETEQAIEAFLTQLSL